MKLWEALKALEENPKKKFESGEWTVKFDYANCIVINDPAATETLINIARDWKEIKQPVTWQEAIEAWLNGKLVTCKHSVSVYEYHNDDEDWFAVMEDQDGDPLSKAEMLGGTWYIEEESK